MRQSQLFKKEQEALDFINKFPLITKEGLAQKMGVSASVAGVYISKLKAKGYLRIAKIYVTEGKEIKVS